MYLRCGGVWMDLDAFVGVSVGGRCGCVCGRECDVGVSVFVGVGGGCECGSGCGWWVWK